jgi:hypothetical protein
LERDKQVDEYMAQMTYEISKIGIILDQKE